MLFTHGGVLRLLPREVGEDQVVPTGSLLVIDWENRKLVFRRDGAGAPGRGLPAAGPANTIAASSVEEGA